MEKIKNSTSILDSQRLTSRNVFVGNLFLGDIQRFEEQKSAATPKVAPIDLSAIPI